MANFKKEAVYDFTKDDCFDDNYFSHIKRYEDTLLHKHFYVEFFFVVAGSCTHYLNGKKYPIVVGDAFLLLPQEDVHTFIKADKDNSFIHRDILFSLDFFKNCCNSVDETLYEDIIQKKYPLSLHLTTEQIANLEGFVSAITLEKNKNNQERLKKILLSYILSTLTLQFYKNSGIPDWLLQLISHFNDPIRFSWPVSKILQDFNFHPVYMCREFKRHMGVTMTDYFNQQKMMHARSLLQSTPFSIEKIGEIVGINSPSYFHRLFKKYYGVSPNSIRGSLKQNINAEP